MDGLGINLKVDARAVKEARRDLEFLNKTLKETEDFDISLGGDELSKDTELLRRASMELTRLGQLARMGENRGGFLNPKQFELVSKLSKDIASSLGGWTTQTQKLRNELKQVTSDLRQLQRDSLSPNLSPLARGMMLDEMEVLSGRKGDLQKEMAARRKYDARTGYMSRRAREYADEISGFETPPERDDGGGSTALLGLGKKAFGYGLALLGVGSMMNMIRSGWDKDQKQEILEAGLLMRGVSYNRRVSPWNYTPQEEADSIMSMRRVTGAGDMESLSRLQRFSRLGNIDMLTSLGIAGGYYQATGAEPAKQRQALDALLYMGKQAKDGRSEALLQLINTNLITAQQAQGGKALSDSQVSKIMSQTTSMYNLPGTMGMSSNLFNAMQNAMMPNGNPTSEIMQWAAAGGFDGGAMTSSRYGDIMRRRSMGLNDPENLKRARAMSVNYGKSPSAQALFWGMFRGTAGQPREYETDYAIGELFGPGGKLTGVSDPRQQAGIIRGYLAGKMPTEDIERLIASATGTYRGSTGFRIGQREMETEVAKLNLGGSTESLVGAKAGYLTKSVVGATGLINAHKYDPLIQAAARKHGISPAWFLGMIMTEGAHGNPNAKSPAGAIGLAQLMPKTFTAYGRKGGSILDPADNLNAGANYFSYLLKRYGSVEAATMAYNEGETKYDKGLRPAETLNYLKSVKKYAGTVSTTGGLGGWDAGSNYPVAVLDPSLKEAWNKMVVFLEKISKNTEHLNVGSVASGSLRPMPVGR